MQGSALDSRSRDGLDYPKAQHAPVAQLDRVVDFESNGCRFESCRACHKPGHLILIIGRLKSTKN